MKVLKFGGGCLKNRASLSRVIEIIKTQKQPVAVVVSALSGITDALLRAIELAVKSEDEIQKILKEIIEKHLEMIQPLEEEEKKLFKEKLELKAQKLQRLLLGISYTGEVTPSIETHILSYGERLSALLVAELLKEAGKKAEAMEADELGIITDDCFENATANLKKTEKNLKEKILPLLEKEVIPIITGYFGRTEEGKIATFGRNGSDYSAAVVAFCMKAEVLELWKDVEGFMSADPRTVPSAKKIDHLSYYEAAELSYFGARIIHPRTFEPLLEAKIPVIIKNLFEPSQRGTVIEAEGQEWEKVVKSITYNQQIAILKILGPGVGYKPGVIAQVGKALSDRGINIYSILTSQTCINLLLDKKDSFRALNVLKEFCDGIINKVELEEDIALVAVVGEGLKRRKGVFARVFSSVAEEGVNVEIVSAGASEVAYYFIVKAQHLTKAIKAIHREFFGAA